MEQQSITFNKGMNKDVATTMHPEGSYLDANNIRLISEFAQSAPIVLNIKGNKLSFDLPDIATVYECIYNLQNQTEDALYTGYAGININGNMIQVDRAGGSLSAFLVKLVEAINSTLLSSNVRACLNKSKTGIIIQSQVSASLTVLPNVDFNADIFVYPTSSLQLIGWTTIRDDIYLIAASGTNSSVNAIFKVEYDFILNTPSSIKLIYSGVLGLSINHIIFDSAITSIYENVNKQKIYFSDNNNPLYFINVVDPECFNKTADDLQIAPAINLNAPILKKINPSGGHLDTGIYNIFYRLTNANGSESIFSPVSNDIRIVIDDETISGQSYTGDVTLASTSKNITVTIKNIDRNYTTVQLGWAYRSTSGVYELRLMTDLPITAKDMDITVDNLSTNLLLLEEDFFAVKSLFDTCKTLTVKNMNLFVANTKNSTFEVDLDVRAYRFKAPGVTYANLPGNNLVNGDSSWDLVETDDAINPYNTDYNDDPTKKYIYQADGTTLGGQGKWLKYTFETYSLYGDEYVNYPTSPQIVTPTNTNHNFGIPGYNYENTSYFSPKSPYLSAIYRGYKRGEVYRFGIVFYSKTGKQSFVKWIGDIKFPETWGNIGQLDFPTSTVVGGVCKTHQMGIRFDIDLSSVANQIGYAEIVRVYRGSSDRTRHSQGIIAPLNINSNNSELYLPEPYNLSRQNFAELVPSTYTDLGGTTISSNYGIPTPYLTMMSPEHNFGDTPSLQTIDYLKPVNRLSITNTSVPPESPADPDCVAAFRKAYTNNAKAFLTKNKYSIKNTAFLTRDTFASFAGKTLYNHTAFNDAEPSKYIGTGIDGLFLEMYDQMDYNSLIEGNTAPYLSFHVVDYVKELTNQYGGASYIARTKNEYISCGTIIPNEALGNVSVLVFGGDTFVSIYDLQKAYPFNSNTPKEKISVTWCFPVETTINVDLREGNTMSRIFSLDTANLSGIGTGEDFIYNGVYTSQYGLKKYIPKPFDFVPVDTFDTRVWASQQKALGEKIDSWTIFKDLDFIDIDPVYGPVNVLQMIHNKLFYFQTKAFGQLSSNERSVIQDTTGTELQLGTGEKLQRYDYITTEAGTFHQGSVTKSKDSIFFFDIWKKKLFKYNGNLETLSDAQGLFSFFQAQLTGRILNEDNPLAGAGISCTYNHIFDEAWYSFKDINGGNTFTVCYSSRLDCFTSFYGFNSPIYINTRNIILSPDPINNNDIYLHEEGNYGEFYTVPYPSDITIVSNKFPSATKVFDNIEYYQDTLDESTLTKPIVTFDTVRQYTDYQDTSTTTLIVDDNVKQRERTWRMPIFRNNGSFDRLRDKFCGIVLRWDNGAKPTTRMMLHYINVLFRTSSR